MIAAVVAAACVVILWKLDTIRPGSLARRELSPLVSEPRAAIPLAMLAFTVFLLPTVLTAIGLGVLGIEFSDEETLRDNGTVAAMTYGFGVAVSAAVGWAALHWKLLKRESLLPRPRDLWIGVGALALSYPLMHFVSVAGHAVVTLTGGDTGSALQHGTLELIAQGDRASIWWWVIIFGAIIGAPIVEEMVFRGLLQPAVRSMLGPWAAVLITGAMFTLLHVPRSPESGGATWLAIPTLAVLSLALGIARERSGRLGVPVVMHIAFNALNVTLALTVIQG